MHFMLTGVAGGRSPQFGGDGAAWVTAALALMAAIAGCVAWSARWAWRIARRVSHFLDDFSGEPARDGVEAKPGVMARLGSVETLLSQVHAETRPNHGSSMRDDVVAIGRDVAELKAGQESLKTGQESMRARIEQIEKQRAGRED